MTLVGCLECGRAFEARSNRIKFCSIECHYWGNVRRTDDCWLWLGATVEYGYGVFGHGGRGVIHYAHRISWEINNGVIPKGLFVLHKCDNPPCTNPDHLFLGT